MKDDYTTNSHYRTYTLLCKKVGRMYFFELGSAMVNIYFCFYLLLFFLQIAGYSYFFGGFLVGPQVSGPSRLDTCCLHILWVASPTTIEELSSSSVFWSEVCTIWCLRKAYTHGTTATQYPWQRHRARRQRAWLGPPPPPSPPFPPLPPRWESFEVPDCRVMVAPFLPHPPPPPPPPPSSFFRGVYLAILLHNESQPRFQALFSPAGRWKNLFSPFSFSAVSDEKILGSG